MRIPAISGVIERRILVNYRVAPEILAKVLPLPFSPKLVHGFGIAGICLIRLKHIRPRFLRLPVGIGSENAAHRIAVHWSRAGEQFEGVYVVRRDTNSRINAIAGGRLFPGAHHHARFHVNEHDGNYDVALDSDDGNVHVSISAKASSTLTRTSAFASLDAASEFFAAGSVGYSPTRHPHRHDGLELRCTNWEMTPLEVTSVQSSFFDDRRVFPAGSAVFDSALLMRRIRHEWHGREAICCESAQ